MADEKKKTSIYRDVYPNKMLSGKAFKALRLDYPNVNFDISETEDKKFRINANVDADTPDDVLKAITEKSVYPVYHDKAPEAVPLEPAAVKAAEEKVEKAAKPRPRWKDTWPDQIKRVQEKLAKGEEPFKVGSKRAISRDLVFKKDENGEIIGCTMKQAQDALGWNKATCSSAFTETAQFFGGRVQAVKKDGAETRYRVVPDTPEEAAARKAVAAAKKEEKAKKDAEKAAKKAATTPAEAPAAAAE